jgi:DNA polymerase-1
MEAGSAVAYSFPFQYAGHFDRMEQLEIKLRLRSILSNSKIGKVAQNFKFEHAWSEFILGVRVRNWKWDTMLCSHVLDARKNYTGLKFQSYINFGVYPYDKHISIFLKDTTGSGFNRIDDAPLDSLLLYGGMDAYLTYQLYNRQLEEFTTSESRIALARGYRLFHEGNLALCEIQSNGIPMNEQYYAKKDKELSIEIRKLYKRLLESDLAKRFQDKTGRELKLKGTNSQKDMKQLFVDILELDVGVTATGKHSFDEKALSKIDIPFTRDLLKVRKLEKVHGTYFAEFKREMCAGKMYPFFDLNGPRSLRSSSSKPNFQNIPVREERAKEACRSGIIPSEGFQLLESDFKGIEVAVAACYTKDPALIEHITNPDNDMHRDAAADIWMLDTNEVTKDIRFYAKNCWVFPQFYGSYYGNCASDLWEAVIEQDLQTTSGQFVVDVLADRGVTSFEAFTEHCQSVEEDFWNVRFRVYKQWKDKIQKQYQKQGYFETFFGFRFHGYLTYNQLCNYPVQGTAFHCLLWTLIRLQQEANSENWSSKILGQIHDSILWDLHPSEREHIIERTIQIGTKDIMRENAWINIPFEIDFEIAPINGSWYEKEEMK